MSVSFDTAETLNSQPIGVNAMNPSMHNQIVGIISRLIMKGELRV